MTIAALDSWQQLELRIWSAHGVMLQGLDYTIDRWASWVASLPCDGPFDWMSWEPWKLMRAMLVPPNPLLPPMWSLPPDPLTDVSRWTLPGFSYPNDADIRSMRNTSVRDILAAAGLDEDANVTIKYRRCGPDPTFEQVKAQYADLEKHPPIPPVGEPLPPDTNHGGDRIPGRYA